MKDIKKTNGYSVYVSKSIKKYLIINEVYEEITLNTEWVGHKIRLYFNGKNIYLDVPDSFKIAWYFYTSRYLSIIDPLDRSKYKSRLKLNIIKGKIRVVNVVTQEKYLRKL